MGKKKCRICGNILIDNYYVITKNSTNKTTGEVKTQNFYYCSKEEYDNHIMEQQHKKEMRDKTYELLCGLLGVKNIIDTSLWKEWAIWNSLATDEQIKSLITKFYDQWKIAIDQKSASMTMYQKIRYVSAMIKNHLQDFIAECEHTKKETIIPKGIEIEAPVLTPAKLQGNMSTRRSLSDLEGEV